MIRTFKKPAIPTQKLPVDDIEVRESGLLIPGKKPIGPVKPTNTSMLDGLEALFYPSYSQFGFFDKGRNFFNPTFGSGGRVLTPFGGDMGYGASGDTTSYLYTPFNVTGVGTTGDFTLFSRVIIFTYVSAYRYIASVGTFNPGIAFKNNATNEFYAYSGSAVDSGFTLSVGSIYSIVAVRSGGTLTTYQNGVSGGSAANSGDLASNAFTIRNSAPAASLVLQRGAIFIAGYLSKAWSQAQILEFYRDPYCLVEPA